MTQVSNYLVANGTGAAVRGDINDRLQALFTNNLGATDTAMTTKYPYGFWADTTANQLKMRNSGNTAWVPIRDSNGRCLAPAGTAALPSILLGGDTTTGFFRPSANSIAASISGTKRLEIKDVGSSEGGTSLLWGGLSVSPHNTNVAGIQFSEAGTLRVGNSSFCLTCNNIESDTTASGFGLLVSFRHRTNGVGQINTDGTTTSYGVTSDYRLKENVVALTGAKARLNNLDVKRFNFIRNPSKTVDGFLAHEVGEIVPEAITGTKDEVDDSGSPVYQNIDQAKLVPLLTAALQEAFAEIAALTARVETLEAG